MVSRIYVEKKDGFNVEARRLRNELADFLGGKYPELAGLKGLRVLKRYDADQISGEQFRILTGAVLSDPRCDQVFSGGGLPVNGNDSFFGVEYAPGQYNQRSDSAEQCAELVLGVKPRIRTAVFYIFENGGKPLSSGTLEAVKKYIINPVDSREPPLELPLSLEESAAVPSGVPVLTGFFRANDVETGELVKRYGLAMTVEDALLCRDWFAKEGRDPTLAELRMLDTYWSDHCRHTTFNTALDGIKISGGDGTGLHKALELYEETRREVYGEKAGSRKRTLMDMATLGAKALKKRGLLNDLDESPEVNACTVKVDCAFADGSTEPWLLLFKNETHNHPTEIEPLGGASTCLGGAIRDPLSGRAYVYQAMRITGGGDPRTPFAGTLPGKLPQLKIAHDAAAGYSSYGAQIGLTTGQVTEFYHPGFVAKRMELGAVVGAAPAAWVRREEPVPGDVVILVGGKTGRDGIGGATGSSKAQSDKSVENAGAEVQKGNAVEERKIVRLFRKAGISRLIKRCNDFGAGGVSVAVGELAAGLDINLDAVPAKYPGLDGTELAISESQERMAVVISAADAETFVKAAAAENLEATVIAEVTAGVEDGQKARLRMNWRGKTIIDIPRSFLSTNGAPRSTQIEMKAPPARQADDGNGDLPAGVLLDNLERELAGLRSGSRRGVQERFDGSIGTASVLFPWGGKEQGTPECGMAALLPSLDKQSRTASLLTYGYDPAVLEHDTYGGAKGSVLEALAKFACLGGDPFKARLSFQEFFESPVDPVTWGKPAAALLGALEAQLCLGVPAVGGKDSMSGNYRDLGRGINLAVPPTLVAFAAGTVPADRIRSGALSGKGGHTVVLLSQSGAAGDKGKAAIDVWKLFKANIKTLETFAAAGVLKAAYPVGPGGVAAALAVMAFGNMTGVEAYADAFSRCGPLDYQGSILAEISGPVPGTAAGTFITAGKTLDEPVFRIVRAEGAVPGGEAPPEAAAAETSLETLRRAYEYPLARVYPQTSTGATVAEAPKKTAPLKVPAFNPGKPAGAASRHTKFPVRGKPLVVLPVFPGTNCEWDMERAFRAAGAETRFTVFRNRSREDIEDSLKELASAFGEAQIIAFSGGFSAGDEPDGSAKFMVNALRSPAVADGIAGFLGKRDGLILGTGNGFQALIKTGLVPYGRILEPGEAAPTLTVNAIGRHVSRMVRTRVMPNVSPWLSLDEPGSIHVIPVSHGEGRLTVRDEEAEALFGAGQVPFCYAGPDGNPTMAEPYNPDGSASAIEGLTSPDGRVLGKMGHSERCGESVHINIPGNKRQGIFEAGVRYFS